MGMMKKSSQEVGAQIKPALGDLGTDGAQCGQHEGETVSTHQPYICDCCVHYSGRRPNDLVHGLFPEPCCDNTLVPMYPWPEFPNSLATVRRRACRRHSSATRRRVPDPEALTKTTSRAMHRVLRPRHPGEPPSKVEQDPRHLQQWWC